MCSVVVYILKEQRQHTSAWVFRLVLEGSQLGCDVNPSFDFQLQLPHHLVNGETS